MSELLNNILEYLFLFRERSEEILLPLLPYFKIGSVIVSVLLLYGIFFCIIKTNWITGKIERWVEVLKAGDLTRLRSLRAWKKIQKNMRSESIADWKTAIIEADKILDELLKASGFRGETIDDRFNQITPEFISNTNQIKEIHLFRNRIINEPNFIIRREDAWIAIYTYQKAFEELGLLG
jgi:hypothetical protein